MRVSNGSIDDKIQVGRQRPFGSNPPKLVCGPFDRISSRAVILPLGEHLFCHFHILSRLTVHHVYPADFTFPVPTALEAGRYRGLVGDRIDQIHLEYV